MEPVELGISRVIAVEELLDPRGDGWHAWQSDL
jgi:hypothetical protein